MYDPAMYLWHRKHSAALGTEQTQRARTVDVSVPGTKLRWRHSCWRGRGGREGGKPHRRESSRLHDPLAPAHHLLQLCPYPVQRQLVYHGARVLGQVVHFPSCVVLLRSDGLLAQRNFSECHLI
jgi:hypothetical protein